MNHSKTHNINLLAGQGATSRTKEQNTDYLPQHKCTTGNKKNIPGAKGSTNSSFIIYLERSLAARERAGLIINFKERQYLKEKPDGKGAGQDFTTPYLLMEGCS